MRCPFCGGTETIVKDSRYASEGDQVRRRRECEECQERFTTYEVAELTLPRMVKRDASREAFNEEKLRQGLLRSLEKRPVSMERVEEAISRIKRRLRAFGEREVQTKVLGDWIMEELRQIDHVAYVRFASVYRRFQDVNAFEEEIQKLRQENVELHEVS